MENWAANDEVERKVVCISYGTAGVAVHQPLLDLTTNLNVDPRLLTRDRETVVPVFRLAWVHSLDSMFSATRFDRWRRGVPRRSAVQLGRS